MPVELPRFQAKDPFPGIRDALLEHGAVIVEELLDREKLDAINGELDSHVAAADPKIGHLNPMVQLFFGDKTRHVSGVAAKSRVFADDILCNPLLLSLCDDILLPSCARYQMNLGHVIDLGPGAQAQMLHRDEDVWVHLPRPHPEIQVASVIALVDFRDEIGATRLVPGSHRWEDRKREATPEEIAVAEMPAGSAVMYLGSTIHGGGANTTRDEWRRGMHLSYTLGWLRTEENQYLSVPPDIARDLPREAQALLGYASHDAIADGGGYLGAVDLVDPVDLLAEGKL